jgi:glycosidase
MVYNLHEAGIEVILDVVCNHTAGENHLGPILSYEGIDNPASEEESEGVDKHGQTQTERSVKAGESPCPSVSSSWEQSLDPNRCIVPG